MSRTRDRKVVGVLIAVAVTAVAAGVVAWAARPHPCKATFERVTPGMTREQVRGTVGGTPEDDVHFGFGVTFKELGSKPREQWRAADAILTVTYSPAGEVESASVAPSVPWPAAPTPWQRLLSHFGF